MGFKYQHDGVCEACVARAGPDGLVQLAMRHWRRVLPDARVMAKGRA
jgi:hypothetical protein